MGKLGLGYVITEVLNDLRDTEERRILLDTRLTKEERQDALTKLEEKLSNYRKDFNRNLNDVYPPNTKKHLARDIKETKGGR